MWESLIFCVSCTGKPELRGYNLAPLSNDEMKAINSLLKKWHSSWAWKLLHWTEVTQTTVTLLTPQMTFASLFLYLVTVSHSLSSHRSVLLFWLCLKVLLVFCGMRSKTELFKSIMQKKKIIHSKQIQIQYMSAVSENPLTCLFLV